MHRSADRFSLLALLFQQYHPLPEAWRIKFLDKMESSYTEQVTAISGLNNFGAQYVMAMIIMAFLACGIA